MVKNIYSFLGCVFLGLIFPCLAVSQGDFESFLKVAQEKRFISDSYKETHLSAIASAEWIKDYDFTSLYFYAQGVKKLYGDSFLQFSVNPPDAICSGTIILRFSSEGKFKEYSLIEVNCQQDEESEFFLNSEFAYVNDSIIEIEYKAWEKINQSFTNERTGYAYRILGKDKIISVQSDPPKETDPEVFRLSYLLLKQEEVSQLSQTALRFMRNGIFARYGYAFHSRDLDLHFTAQSWYKKSGKTHEAILAELTPIEQINIQIIRQAEQDLKLKKDFANTPKDGNHPD